MGYEAWKNNLDDWEAWKGELAQQNFTEDHNWTISNILATKDGLVVWVKMLEEHETKATKCNWVQLEGEPPEWHCDWGCKPLLGLAYQGYWQYEVIFPAPQKHIYCSAIFPKWEFWGHYDLKCDKIPVTNRTRTKPARKHPTTYKKKAKEATVKHGNVVTYNGTLHDAGPTVNHDKKQTTQHAPEECLTDIRRLDPCIWNTWVRCGGQNFLPLGPLWYQSYYYRTWRSIFSPHNAMHEKWLNYSFPWIWVKKDVVHYQGDYPEGTARHRHGLKGPYQSDMYVQKLPTVEELRSVPKGDFDKIDKCVARRIFFSLNESE
ncbi:uncharacterized protein LOC106512431 [Austrofundulus limnaeus]|uniref:Uncharacterized protein LOC106512431 n=1 Tax=Austrofundulus limnaeus TaxID=52670 RepID=A0A2I4ALZ5_AUSLI|nr:PREDICTED: uncharacterized protein LOC106512431 [Austrofundulus limnaeus]